MPELIKSISSLRNSVCSILRIHLKKEKHKKGKVKREFEIALVGSAFCIVANRLLLTAFHIFNNGKERDPNDKFYAFTVPDNGPNAYDFPVTSFPLEDNVRDFAIIELGPPAAPGREIPSAPIIFKNLFDGTRVVTYGFPAPIIAEARVDENANYRGGSFFLKGHANEGIIAGQFEIDGIWSYELNVGWHHGESGGPICCIDPIGVFAIMQGYRNIKSPHGIMAGPHSGRSLASIERNLRDVGATII